MNVLGSNGLVRQPSLGGAEWFLAAGTMRKSGEKCKTGKQRLMAVSIRRLRIITTKAQDPVVGDAISIFGVDMWEHAYYLWVSPYLYSYDISSMLIGAAL